MAALRAWRASDQCEDLLRTAASLKPGWVPASLLVTRLKNTTPQSLLAAALGEYGRIVRANSIDHLHIVKPAVVVDDQALRSEGVL